MRNDEMKFIREVFTNPECSVRVPMVALTKASIIWLNQRAMRRDPLYFQCRGDQARYRNELTRRCAVAIGGGVIAGNSVESGPVTGWGYVDRYGGKGIGRNGGSGRSVYANGYYLKGIGCTPLIHADTSSSHASGGAFLEECVRETIFSEIVEAEFPRGAVPVLAIIDTGKTVVWDTPAGPKAEMCTILVRPPFVRPAHLEPAYAFTANRVSELQADLRRVHSFLANLERSLGRLEDWLVRFAEAWAEQTAYSFVHCLPHCGNTTSNISIHGELLDFGAMSAVPSWGRVRLLENRVMFGDELLTVIREANILSASVQHFAGEVVDPDKNARVTRSAAQRYSDTILFETLRLCGMKASVAREVLRSTEKLELASILAALKKYYRLWRGNIITKRSIFGELTDIFQAWEAPERIPEHLKPLRAFLEKVTPIDERELLAARARRIGMPREELFRAEIREWLYAELNPGTSGQFVSCERVSEVINSVIQRSRRDSRVAEVEREVVTKYLYLDGVTTVELRDGRRIIESDCGKDRKVFAE